MNIRNFTLATAIFVSMSAGSLTSVLATCPCQNQVKPQTTCTRCKQALPKCKCNKTKPTDTVSCDKPAIPSVALCPQSSKPNKAEMKQVYGYPQAIYGTNNYVGEPANSIISSESKMQTANLQAENSGVVISSTEQPTGAAAQLPVINNISGNGIAINRDEDNMDGNNCPIDIQTQNSITAIKKSLVPYEIPDSITGAASSLNNNGCMFPDVSNGHWAACDIDKLAINNVVIGYPDGYFKPNKNISRAEFASILVKGFNLDCNLRNKTIFKDVSANNWANPSIAKAVEENLLKGYPNKTFKPKANVTRVEALASIAKGMTCDIDTCKADEILNKYADGNKVPDWARIPVAKALQNGALQNSPNANLILPNKNASRAEVASMMQTVRVALGYDTNPKTAHNVCPACPIEKNAFVEKEESLQIPTLKLSMIDQLTAKSSHVGQYFRANTLEEVTINGVNYPCGSTVTGQVVEVIRPSGCDKGALRLSFTEIKNGDCKSKLPKQILQAQINKSKNVNPVARFVEMPFTWAGSLAGVVGRTTGGILTNAGNAIENITNDTGYMLGHAFQGQFGAAARSLGDGLFETVKAPVDMTRTALSGTMGLFQTTGDEFAYLVDPRGYKISAVNPKEHITIAFGCNE